MQNIERHSEFRALAAAFLLEDCDSGSSGWNLGLHRLD
jgi:hypothetical protein